MIIGFLPLRSGSKGIPNKNIKIFNGKPLLYWNLSALENCSKIDKIIVATNCDDIAAVANAFGFKKIEIYFRSSESANDTAPTEQVLLEFLSTQIIAAQDSIVLTQATSPLTEAAHLEEAIALYQTGAHDSILSCVPSKRFIWDYSGTAINYDYKNRPRRQDFQAHFIENGAIYISSAQGILESGCRLNGRVGIYAMHEESYFELDDPIDWDILEFFHTRRYATLQMLSKKIDIKLVFSDVDGTLTDGGMYYDLNNTELKKFNAKDGKGFELLREQNIRTGLITSEHNNISQRRSLKLKTDYHLSGLSGLEKLVAICKICNELNINLSQVAYIGDDINCLELLCSVGFAACPHDSSARIKAIPNIFVTDKRGGDGAFREFAEKVLRLNS